MTGCFTVATYYPRWQWLIFPTIRITDTDDTLANAHTLLDRLENECGTAEHLCSTSQLIEARMASNKNSATGLTTGFADLDRVTCGWQPGEEIVIAARPAVGKTAFTLHLVRTAASAGYHIAVYIFTYTIFFLMNN